MSQPTHHRPLTALQSVDLARAEATFCAARQRRGRATARAWVLVVCLVSWGGAGCAKWMPERVAETKAVLPAPKLSPDSVTIETVLVRFPLESTEKLQELWRTVDESILDMELRQQLDKNGLRAGILQGDLPPAIRDQLAQTSSDQTTDALEHAGLAADADNKMRQLSCRAGRRKELIVRREVAEPLTVVTTQAGRLAGETFERASALFDLRVIPHADGRATIQLVPEIQHGDHYQSFVSSEFGVRPEIKRRQATWKHLTVQAKLRPQQILMLSSTLPPKALGSALFVTKTAVQTEEHVVLLIRLGKTQMDELFAPEILEQAHALTER